MSFVYLYISIGILSAIYAFFETYFYADKFKGSWQASSIVALVMFFGWPLIVYQTIKEWERK